MAASAFRLVVLLPAIVMLGCPSGDDPGADDSGAGSVGESGDAGDSEGADETGSDLGGEELFGMLCMPCHGPSGEGTPLGYELQHPVRIYSGWVARNGRPGPGELDGSTMAAYSDAAISDTQLEEIWDYLDSFPRPTTGEGLYLDYCRNCHGVDARGGPTGVDLHEPEAQLEFFEKIREGENTGVPGDRFGYMPAFDATWITDEQMQLIKDYVATL